MNNNQIKHFYILFFKTTAFVLLFLFIFIGCKTSKDVSSNPNQDKNALPEKEELKFKHTFHDASKEKILGNYEMASELYIQCIKINPKQADPFFELASIYDYLGKGDKALNFAREAVRIDPGNVWYKLLYADLLKKNGQSDKVIKIYDDLIRENPSKIEYYYELANAYLNVNNVTEAIRVYDKMEEQFGINDEVIVQKQKLYLAIKKTDKAIEEIQKLISLFPSEARYLGMLAEIYQQTNNMEKAIDLFDKILKLEPDNAFVLLSLSEYYKKQGDNEKSFQYLEKAFLNQSLEIDNKVKILLNYYVLTETDTSLRKQAYILLDALVKTNPTEAKAFSIYGDFLYRDKKIKEARERFRSAVKLEKDKFAIWNQILVLDAELEDYESMDKESEAVLELFPTQPFLYLYNGVANLQLNNLEKSIESFEAGVNLVVDNNVLSSQFHANLGDAYHKLKQNEKSDMNYDKSLKLEPDNILVLNNYSYYLALRGEKFEKAEQMSKRSNELAPNNSNLQDTYAWVLYKMGKYDVAKKMLEQALQNGGNTSATVIEHYGDALFQLNEKDKALEYWKKAKETGKGSDLLDKKILEKNLTE